MRVILHTQVLYLAMQVIKVVILKHITPDTYRAGKVIVKKSLLV
ncbi:MAG: hypothetical protein ACFFD4_01805 [Candidatus Odinarchaeota archaeon]